MGKALITTRKAELMVLHIDAMKERAECLGAEWVDLADGYMWMVAMGSFAPLAYIAIPLNHPLVGVDYDELEDYGPSVNGGVTYASGNVFGWDYGHYMNNGTPAGDVVTAMSWFAARAK